MNASKYFAHAALMASMMTAKLSIPESAQRARKDKNAADAKRRKRKQQRASRKINRRS